MNCVDAGRLLDPYLDDELEREPAETLRVHLSACARCSERLAERAELSRLIRAIPAAAAPARLRHNVLAAARKRRITVRLLAVAATIAFVAATGASLLVFREMRERTVETAVVAAHVRSLGAGPLVEVTSSDRHTVKPWFQGRVDFAPPVEDTAAAGFPLMGGRIDRLGSEPVAALVYRRRLHTISVFIRPESPRDAGGSARNIRGFEVRHWTRGRMAFWAVSDVNGADLDLFVRTLQSASP